MPVATARIASSRVLKRSTLALGRYCWVIRSWEDPRSTATVMAGSLSEAQVAEASSGLGETMTKLL
ncbi:hypothetical protein D3C73_1575090 [compost metagenome]